MLCDLDTVVVKYVKRVTDPTKFDPLLVKAIAYRMAADIATRITESKTVRNDMLQAYEWQLNRAATIDGIETEEPQQEEYAIRDAKDE